MTNIILLILGGSILAILAILATWWLFLHPRWMLAIYLVLIPFHSLAVNILRVDFGLSGIVLLVLQMWKDVLLLLMVGWIFWKIAETVKVRLSLNHFLIFLLVIVFVVVGLLGFSKAPTLFLAMYAWRGTFEPYMLLIVALLPPIDKEWLQKLIPAMLFVGTLVTIFAIYQILFLGFPFIWKYFAVDGMIPTSFSFSNGSFQRAMGTFSSPNTFSLYLGFLIVILVNLLLRRKIPVLVGWGYLVLFVLGLVLTVSRSGWLATIAGVGFSLLIWKRKQRIALILVSLGLVGIMVGLGLGLGDWILHSVSGREASANYHMDMLIKNGKVILENPLGVGLGRVGARGFRYLESIEGNYYPTESYLLQVGMETGIPGLFILLALVGLCSIHLSHNIYRSRTPYGRMWAVIGISVLLAALVHSILIPDLQDLTLSSFLWFIVGIGLRIPNFEGDECSV